MHNPRRFIMDPLCENRLFKQIKKFCSIFFILLSQEFILSPPRLDYATNNDVSISFK